MSDERLLRMRELPSVTGLSRSELYARLKLGAFPAPIPLGTPHVKAWLASDVQSWIREQVRAARPAPAGATAP